MVERITPSSATSRHTRPGYFSDNFLVVIYSSVHKGVTARLPEELQFQLSSEWDTPLASSGASPVEALIQSGFGVSTKTQFASAQVWSGSTPIEMTLQLDFYAEQDPKREVVDPIIRLSKMALPRRSGEAGDRGLFIPPGPRVFGFNTRNIGNDQISIQIGNFMNFTKVVVLNVDPVFSTRDMTSDGYPLRATCEVTFRSMFSLTGNDFEEMFV